MMFMTSDSGGKTVPSTGPMVSLADSYVVHIHDDDGNGDGDGEVNDGKASNGEGITHSTTWTLVPLTDYAAASPNIGVGIMAVNALRKAAGVTYDDRGVPMDQRSSAAAASKGGIGDGNDGRVVLTCRGFRPDCSDADATIHIEIDSHTMDLVDGNSRGEEDLHQDLSRLISLLSTVAAQTLAQRISDTVDESSANTTYKQPDDDNTYISITLPSPADHKTSTTERFPLFSVRSPHGYPPLFAQLLPHNANVDGIEMSDMVDSDGRPLGYIPRSLVHGFNILHRGIGIVVCQGGHITRTSGEGGDETALPSVYVHRRTDTKRIFPGLYDMFVGGVSTTGEKPFLTAAREIAEELGLTRALSQFQQDRSPNPLSDPLFRCTVCTSYNRCVVTLFTYAEDGGEIVRWQEEEVAWGEFVPYGVVGRAAASSIRRLEKRGEWPGAMGGEDGGGTVGGGGGDGGDADGYQWQTWDFRPDGLLVWEAWLEWINGDG